MSATKPMTEEDLRQLQYGRELMEQVREEGQLVASGCRRMNRVGNEDKQRFVDSFIASGKVREYPVVDADLQDENLVGYVGFDETTKTQTLLASSMQGALTLEIGRAFEKVGQRKPAIARVMAANLLASDLGGQLGVLGAVPSRNLEVELVLAHFEALGYKLPPRVSVSIARRAMMVILNRDRFVQGGTS